MFWAAEGLSVQLPLSSKPRPVGPLKVRKPGVAVELPTAGSAGSFVVEYQA